MMHRDSQNAVYVAITALGSGRVCVAVTWLTDVALRALQFHI
ncbi:MAG TPA: hypothetical protein VMU40_05495 [Steroidobacteraceae bacterium]|nr:hypothetical protein [Steroidobacteraceae bacterium]